MFAVGNSSTGSTAERGTSVVGEHDAAAVFADGVKSKAVLFRFRNEGELRDGINGHRVEAMAAGDNVTGVVEAVQAMAGSIKF